MNDKPKFYGAVRLAFGPITSKQVEGFEAILDSWDMQDVRWLAYMLATAWHETAKTMQAIAEYGKGKNKPYGKIHPATGKVYYGRGLVQLTWWYNYKKMSNIIYGDNRLYKDPNLALDLETATRIMYEGMTTGKSFKGDFTGKHLAQFFNAKTDDPVNARKIINGLDKAQLIASYHAKFLSALAA